MSIFKQLYSKIETVVLRSATFQKVATEYYDKKDKLGMAPGPITYKRQPSDMRTKEIKDWQQAVMEATDPDRPRCITSTRTCFATTTFRQPSKTGFFRSRWRASRLSTVKVK